MVVIVPYNSIPPASKNIDHPSRPWRIFFRIMAVCACNFFSWMVAIFTLAVMVDFDYSGLPDIYRALLLAAIPVPLLVVFYWLFAKATRKMERDMLR
ncbi:hypothetical protein [Pseudomonas coronafaciens]|uniref:hypothetical protein n=1 Tax=Pseudomonas coronafaciens TaxID=53409 RepID=UPI0006D630CC|nr:hypothetical protein [Pseudomonas coronafaciens]